MTVVSKPVKPFSALTGKSTLSGNFAAGGTASFGTVIYSVDGGTNWPNSKTATALTGATVDYAIGWVNSLTALDLSNCGLSAAPTGLADITTIKSLNLGGNPLSAATILAFVQAISAKTEWANCTVDFSDCDGVKGAGTIQKSGDWDAAIATLTSVSRSNTVLPEPNILLLGDTAKTPLNLGSSTDHLFFE